MTDQKRYYILIPVYNEVRVIRQVIRELTSHGYKNIIVIDDGSTDATSEDASKEKVTVLRHRINRGKGAAIATGMEAARRRGADLVVTFDGDGQHDPKDINKLISNIAHGYDMVLGSRFLSSQHIPRYKRIANYVANCITYLVYGIWVTDSQSGLRAYGKKAFTSLDTKSDRYDFDTEVLRTIRKYHFTYKEIPIHVRYTQYSQKKENRQNIFSAILTMLKVILSA